jgi:3-dehydroquinate dehydratase-2
MNLLVLNGPNIARLGTREPAVYGSTSWEQLQRTVVEYAATKGFEADVRQTDSEAELIGWLHEAADAAVPVILNPAAFTHYSYGVRDAAAQLTAPLIEVHISNPATREDFRHTSVIAGVATGTIAGFGVASYLLAVDALVALDAR